MLGASVCLQVFPVTTELLILWNTEDDMDLLHLLHVAGRDINWGDGFGGNSLALSTQVEHSDTLSSQQFHA